MKVKIKDGKKERLGAQPVGGIKKAEELIKSLAMTMLLEKAMGRKTVTMEVELSGIDTDELKAAVEQLGAEVQQPHGSLIH